MSTFYLFLFLTLNGDPLFPRRLLFTFLYLYSSYISLKKKNSFYVVYHVRSVCIHVCFFRFLYFTIVYSNSFFMLLFFMLFFTSYTFYICKIFMFFLHFTFSIFYISIYSFTSVYLSIRFLHLFTAHLFPL